MKWSQELQKIQWTTKMELQTVTDKYINTEVAIGKEVRAGVTGMEKRIVDGTEREWKGTLPMQKQVIVIGSIRTQE